MSSRPGARGERWSAVGLAAIALAYLYAGREYSVDTLAAPGPGLFPLAAGLALFMVAGGHVLASALRGVAPTEDAREVPHARRSRLLMVGLLIAYVASLGNLGFLAASFTLVILAARLMGAPGWWRPALLAAGVALTSYLIFVVWLGVPLPTGPLP